MNKPLFFLLLPVFFACSETDDLIRQKLEFVLEDDLRTIADEIRKTDASALLDRPFYRIMSYQAFDKNLSFNRKAVVEFYYLRKIQMIQVRKYRYSPAMRQWQRYDKVVEYNLS